MLKKFTSSFLLVFMILCLNVSYSQDNIRRVVKAVNVTGSEVVAPTRKANTINHTTDNYQPLTTNSLTVTYHPFGSAGFYDLQSNGSPNEIWQDPLSPGNVHAAVMVLPVFGGTRFVHYYFSNDRGQSWTLLGNVAEAQSGFPSIDGYPNSNPQNGAAVITVHTTAGGLTAARSQVFVDGGAGFGVFARLDPGLNGTNSMIWGRIITTGSPTNAIKYILNSSVNGSPITGINRGLDLTPPGTFSGWVKYDANQAESYSLALGQDGRIGNAYIIADAVSEGSVAFRESMDNGLTWGAPVTLYNANLAADSLGDLRGVSMIYIGNTPCVVFELENIVTTEGLYGQPSKILFWSPAINGGAPKVIADRNNVPFNPNSGPNPGVFTPLCRPVIGRSDQGNFLFVAMNAATAQHSADLNTYFASYLTYSANAGANWTTPERITPTTPLKDWRYISLSHTNSKNVAGNIWHVQMVCENHDYAGAFAPSQPPGPSDFIGIIAEVPLIGVKEINSTVPDRYNLQQNFPNPFNPTTAIRFDISKSTNITLKVYNANGQEVATLINNEVVAPGTKEVTFNASDLGSGIYFYTLYAGDFKETKKMMLIK